MPPWLLGLVFLPLAAGSVSFVGGRRVQPYLSILTCAAVTASALLAATEAAAGASDYALGGWAAPLGVRWHVDVLSASMLLTTATIALVVTVFGMSEPAALGRGAPSTWFWPLSLFLVGSLNALFLSGDLFNLYVTLELVTLGAVGLVVLSNDAQSVRAAMRYLLIALAGSLSYLLGVGLLYAAHGTLDIALVGQSIAPTAGARMALALISVGLLAKTALFPLHVWLPPAHSAAPTAASALLSALVVMGSMYCLLRLWAGIFAAVATPAFAQLLGTLGVAAVIWGSLLALTQRRLKLLVAYSTVSQLGYLLLLPPLLSGAGAASAWRGGAWLLISHAFAKAAMFLAAGLILHARGHDYLSNIVGAARQLPMAVFAIGLAGLSLMGVPPSGGFIAKWLLLTAAVESGQWWWVAPLVIGGLLAAGYMFRVLNPAFRGPEGRAVFRPVPRSAQLLCLSLALVSMVLGVYTLPWLELLGSGLVQ